MEASLCLDCRMMLSSIVCEFFCNGIVISLLFCPNTTTITAIRNTCTANGSKACEKRAAAIWQIAGQTWIASLTLPCKINMKTDPSNILASITVCRLLRSRCCTCFRLAFFRSTFRSLSYNLNKFFVCQTRTLQDKPLLSVFSKPHLFRSFSFLFLNCIPQILQS